MSPLRKSIPVNNLIDAILGGRNITRCLPEHLVPDAEIKSVVIPLCLMEPKGTCRLDRAPQQKKVTPDDVWNNVATLTIIRVFDSTVVVKGPGVEGPIQLEKIVAGNKRPEHLATTGGYGYRIYFVNRPPKTERLPKQKQPKA